jgi:tetratricopeptide (TPR) repeat protein
VLALYDIFKSIIKNGKAAVALAVVLSMTIPALMAAENWDDHDRSNRYFSVDSAKNYLNSCAPNAIIFTGGDNDTFPLWYAQEVEGFRTDVRVIVLSYFNTDWYISQMMRDAYESKALPFSLSLSHYQQGGLNDYLPVVENPNIKGAINAKLYLELVKKNHPQLKIPLSNGSYYNSIPAKSMFLDVDVEKVKALKIVPEYMEKDITSRMEWSINGRGLEKNDLAVIDLIVNSNWERPIYFNTTSLSSLHINLRRYVVQEGIAYRLTPVLNPDPQSYNINTELMYDNMMNNYFWRELDNPEVYYSEDYRNFVLNHRSAYNTLAENLIEKGRYDQALTVIKTCLQRMPNESLTFDYFNIQQVGILLTIDKLSTAEGNPLPEAKVLADNIAEITSTDNSEVLAYMIEKNISDQMELQKRILSLNELVRSYRAYGDKEKATEYEKIFEKYYSKLQR